MDKWSWIKEVWVSFCTAVSPLKVLMIENADRPAQPEWNVESGEGWGLREGCAGGRVTLIFRRLLQPGGVPHPKGPLPAGPDSGPQLFLCQAHPPPHLPHRRPRGQ